jgi:hypothetical protein
MGLVGLKMFSKANLSTFLLLCLTNRSLKTQLYIHKNELARSCLMAKARSANDFIILGPAMSSGMQVLNAVHALYFLPESFKLVLAGSKNTDQTFLEQVMSLVKRDELSARVRFSDRTRQADAVILPNVGMSRRRNAITGDSPEALASAILHVARSAI